MTNYREIKMILPAGPFHWVGNGFRVINYLPSARNLTELLSPFILLDYNPAFYFKPTTELHGVGAHPHRGFETVTIAYQGAIAHHDSVGHSGVINPGDVQWMTAGSGILHKEYHEQTFAQKGGVLQMAQLWVNLPKIHKLAAPNYQSILNEQISRVELPNEAGQVRVIAGTFEGVKGAATTFTPINLFDIRLNHNGVINLPLPKDYNTAVLILEGNIKINSLTEAETNDFIIFENNGSDVKLEATSESAIVLLLNGRPLNEPISHYGPFVMNTEQELQQAFADYRAGRFGYLE